jgi:hypothetical protein
LFVAKTLIQLVVKHFLLTVLVLTYFHRLIRQSLINSISSERQRRNYFPFEFQAFDQFAQMLINSLGASPRNEQSRLWMKKDILKILISAPLKLSGRTNLT